MNRRETGSAKSHATAGRVACHQKAMNRKPRCMLGAVAICRNIAGNQAR